MLTPNADDSLFGPWAAEAALQLLDSTVNLRSGRQLGPYVIEKKLGDGGMGTVYCAGDTRLNRRVALKIVDAAPWVSKEWQDRFLGEARTIASLSHPNLCALHDVGEHEGMLYLVMELIDGETLAQRLERGPLPESEALAIGITLASALDYAHSRGVVHRDIKPGNLMLTPWGVKLLDFGIAWNSSQSMDVIQGGTLRYEAPEQFRGEPDARSDLFSFGVVLFEMIGGRLPDSPDFSRTSGSGGTIAKDVLKVIRRCVAADPNERWQTANELKQAIQAVFDSRRGRRRAKMIILVCCGVLTAVATLLAVRLADHRIRSVAILPLDEVSPAVAGTFLADELTEDIIRDLRNAKGLRVISFQSAAGLRGTHKPLGEIARDLQVEDIVKGAVHRSGDELRLQLSIFDGKSGRAIAAVERSRSMIEATRLLDEVTHALAARLDSRLPERPDGASLRHKVIPAAWMEYARGRQLCTAIFTGRLENMTPDDASAGALIALDRSIHLDPEFAPAHTAKASCLWSRLLIGLDSPARKAPQIRNAALRAISLDQSAGEPYAFLGAVRLEYDWDWEGADAAFQRAISLEPGSAVAHSQYAQYLTATGRFEEALREAKEGGELDPDSLMSTIVVPWSRVAAGDLESAVRGYQALTRKNPEAGAVYPQLTWVLEKLGRKKEAAETYRRAREFYPAGSDHLMDAWLMDETIVQAGRDTAVNLARYWRAEEKRHYVDPYNIAEMYLALGDTQEVFSLLRQSVVERSPSVFFLNAEPWFLSIRQIPAYRELVRSLDLE